MLEKMDARYPEVEKNVGNKHHDHSQLIPYQYITSKHDKDRSNINNGKCD